MLFRAGRARDAFLLIVLMGIMSVTATSELGTQQFHILLRGADPDHGLEQRQALRLGARALRRRLELLEQENLLQGHDVQGRGLPNMREGIELADPFG